MPVATALMVSGVLGAGASLVGGGKAASAADDASRRQEAMQQQDLAFRQQVYNDQKSLYGPLQQRLVNMANSDQPLNWGQVSGQIANQYSDAVRQVNQGGGQGQYGGLKYDRLTKLGLAHATGRVSAYNQGLMNRLNLGLSVSGQNQIMPAASMYAQGMSQASATYGQQAAMFGQGAASAYGAAGTALTNAGLSYAMLKKP